MEVSVIEFLKTYPNINTELSEAKFKLAIIAIYESELSRGFIVKKQTSKWFPGRDRREEGLPSSSGP